ncbi:MAG: DUF3311 domain-containing protein [Jatrophihabitans sp.]
MSHRTSDEEPPEVEPTHPGRLPRTVQVQVGVLLAIPMLALLVVPIYSKTAPEIGGWPFFYWYQMVWVVLASAFTYTAHRLVNRARAAHRSGR